MELSVSAWCLQKKLYSKEMDILDFIEYCNENGVKNVELLDCFFNDNIEKAITLLKNNNMKVSSYSIGNDFVNIDAYKRESQLDSVISGINTAVMLNTKLMRVFCGDVKEGITYKQGEKWILENLEKASKYAEKKGITLALENHGFFAGSSNGVKKILSKINSPYLRATTDVGNFMLVEENPLDAIINLKDYIGFVHFKDFKDVGDQESVYTSINGKHFQGMVLGKGDVPLIDVVNYLYSIDYKGYLSIEYEGVEDPVWGTTESIKYAKSIIK